MWSRSIILEERPNELLDFNTYQAEALKTARFGPVGHPSVPDFLRSFAATGRAAERAKKVFRDQGGTFGIETPGAIESDLDDARHWGSHAVSRCYEPEAPSGGNAIVYPVFGLVGESGEVAEKVLKMLERGQTPGGLPPGDRLALVRELSDVLWYVAAVAGVLGTDLGDVAEENLSKLRSRRDRGAIHGSGDDR